MNSILSENTKSYKIKYKTIKSPLSLANVKKLRVCNKCGKEWITKNRFQFRCFKCHDYEDEYGSIRNEGWIHHV